MRDHLRDRRERCPGLQQHHPHRPQGPREVSAKKIKRQKEIYLDNGWIDR